MKLFGFIPVPQFGINLVNGEFFRGVVRKSFDEVDVDHDNELDHKELYIALLKVFDNLNEKLPCHVSVPPLDEINRLMAKYDVNSSGKLDFEEFLALTKSLVRAVPCRTFNSSSCVVHPSGVPCCLYVVASAASCCTPPMRRRPCRE